MIGPPGAGKTTVIHNSGLDYPLKDKLGVTDCMVKLLKNVDFQCLSALRFSKSGGV